MRHRKKFNHLSRKKGHRQSMLANMASSLILHKRIRTTTAKAKALRSFIEPLITRSKEDSTHSRRMVFRYLRDKYAVSELFREVATKVADRPGGYTRIIKLDNRLGDNADMCIMELVDYNETMLTEKGVKPKAAKRRRGRKKTATQPTVETVDVQPQDTEKIGKEEVTDQIEETSGQGIEQTESDEKVAGEKPPEETQNAEKKDDVGSSVEKQKKEAGDDTRSDMDKPGKKLKEDLTAKTKENQVKNGSKNQDEENPPGREDKKQES